MINGRGEFQAAVSIRIKIFIRVRTHSQTSRLIKRWWSWIRRIARVSVCENRKRELFPYVVSREGEGRERERESEREKGSFGLRRIEKKIQNLAGFLITCLLPRFKRTNRCMMYDVCIYVCTHAMFPIKSRLCPRNSVDLSATKSNATTYFNKNFYLRIVSIGYIFLWNFFVVAWLLQEIEQFRRRWLCITLYGT